MDVKESHCLLWNVECVLDGHENVLYGLEVYAEHMDLEYVLCM